MANPESVPLFTSTPNVTPIFHSLSEAYMSILSDVYHQPDYVHQTMTPEDMKSTPLTHPVINNPRWYFNKTATQEKTNYHFIIRQPRADESITTKSAKRNEIIYDYSCKETVMFDQGDCCNIKQLSKVWERIANPDGTINANYGYMVYHLIRI